MTLRICLLAAAAISAAFSAEACSCAPYASAEEKIESTEFIFIGAPEETVALATAEGDDSAPSELMTRFWVSRAIKGVEGTNVYIRYRQDMGACGFAFPEGGRVLVFAHRGDGQELETDLCSMLRRTRDGSDVLDALEISEEKLDW